MTQKMTGRAAALGAASLFLAAAAPGLAQDEIGASESPDKDWAELAQTDLDFIYQTFLENHSGAVDPENPEYRQWMDDGYVLASNLASQAESPAGYYFAIKRYFTGFQDAHTSINVSGLNLLPWYAPGFAVLRKPGDGGAPYYEVAAVEEGRTDIPPLGAKLISCDGKSAEDLLDERIGRFMASVEPEAKRYRNASWLLYDAGNPYLERPESCVIEVDGTAHTYTLTWTHNPPGGEESLRNGLTRFPKRKNEMREFAPDAYWIAMPRMLMDDDDPGGAPALREIITTLKDDPDTYRNARALVFDLRANSGGSSTWISEMAQALWGEDYLEATGNRDHHVQYRVSEDNAAYFHSLLDEHFSDPGHAFHDYVKTLAEGVEAALEAGEDYWTHPESLDAPFEGEIPPDRVRADVYMLTDYSCGSACLDAADLLNRLGAIQFGLPTSGDTSYLEVRQVDLPSGYGSFWVSMNVHRGRARGWNEPYTPQGDHLWRGDISDTEALEDWVRARLPMPAD